MKPFSIIKLLILTLAIKFAAMPVCYSQVHLEKIAPTTGGTNPNPLWHWEHLPPGYDTAPDNTFPLLIFFHGKNERSDTDNGELALNELTTKKGTYGPIREVYVTNKNMCFTPPGQAQECFVVLSPQIRSTTSWSAANVGAFVKYAYTKYKVDINKIYLAGVSMGGLGVLKYVQGTLAYSGNIAAVAVMPGGQMDTTRAEACKDLNNRDIAFWAIHGKNDDIPQTLAQPMRMFVDAINRSSCTKPASPKAYLYMYPNRGHNVWHEIFKMDRTAFNPNLYDWFLKNRKGASTFSANQAPVINFLHVTSSGTKPVPYARTGVVEVVSNTSSTTIRARPDDWDQRPPTYGGVETATDVKNTVWSKIAGDPVTWTQAGANAWDKHLNVSGMQPGKVYTFRLSTQDFENKTKTRDIKIRYSTAPATNTSPVISAGADKSLSSPSNSVMMIGDATDSDGTIATTTWTQDSSDATPANIITANNITTNVDGMDPGYYNFYLTVTDNEGAVETDHVEVKVEPDITDDNSYIEFTSNSLSGKRTELYAAAPPNNANQEFVRTGGNDYLQFYLKTFSGTPNFANMQIGLTVSYQTMYLNILSQYVKETDEDGWTRILMPLDDFLHDPSKWATGGVSSVGFKIVSFFGSGTIVFGVDQIEFVGSATPYLWFGDTHERFADEEYVFNSDSASFHISNIPQTGGVDDILPPGGGWLKMTSATAASGKRIELYRDSTRSNGVQEAVRAGGNDFIQYYFKVLSGTPNWSNFQIGLTVSYQNRYLNVLPAYIKETNAEGWTRVEMPLADFLHDPVKWTSGGVSNVGFKIAENFGPLGSPIVFGVDEVTFTGGTTPFVWYGDPRETSGNAECVFMSDASSFYISERLTQGGVLEEEEGGGSFAMVAPDERTQPEPEETFHVSVYDGHGQYIKSFKHRSTASGLQEADFTPYIKQKGMFMFRIVNQEGQVTSERIVYVN